MRFALGEISGERLKGLVKKDLAARIDRAELDDLPFRNMRERQIAEKAGLVLLREQFLTTSHGHKVGCVGLNHPFGQASGARGEH